MTDQDQQNGSSDKAANGRPASPIEEPTAKRQRVEAPPTVEAPADGSAAPAEATTQENGSTKKVDDRDNRDKGFAPIKKEYVLSRR